MSVGNVQISVIPPTAVPTVPAITAPAAAASQQSQTQAASKTTAVAKVASPVKAPTPVVNNTVVTDAASLSTTAVVLSGLESQLTTSKPSDFKGLLENAARSIYDAAAQQDSKEQSKTLENIADRLQFAANIAGLSTFSPLSIEAFLE